MIPKIVHYCWFGRGEKPRLAKKCIASWKKLLPDYVIMEWNEENFDIRKYPYAQFCLDNKKYAFLSDFVRLVVVYENGGIYFDTDVELVRRPDLLLDSGAFYGFENNNNINTGLGFGAIKGHASVLAMMHEYSQLQPDSNGSYPIIGCPKLNTQALLPFGLKLTGEEQLLGDIHILSKEYLAPYDDPTGCLKKTKKTISIHWYGKSWMSKKSIIRSYLTKPFHRLFGVDVFRKH